MNLYLIINSFIGFILSWFLTKYLIKYLPSKFLDIPNKRSSHKKNKVKGGGLVFPIILIPFSIIYNNFVPLICMPLAIVGLIDDIKDIKPIYRLFSQIITVLALLFYSKFNITINNEFGLYFSTIILILIIFFSVGLINFINFMDGIDGLVAGCLIIVFGIFSISNPLSLIIFSILLGFLFWNWEPSKIFMGDVGSTYLGSLIIGFIFTSSNIKTSYEYVLLLSPLLADAFFTVLRRLFYKLNVFSPHRMHLYQRLNIKGFSHAAISKMYIIATIFLCSIYFTKSTLILTFSTAMVLCSGYIIDKKLAVPFKS